MITKLLMGLLTRDADAFVAFVERLQNKADALVHRHATDIGKVQGYIDQTHEDYSEAMTILRLRTDTAKARIEAEFMTEWDKLNSWLSREVRAGEAEIAKIEAKIIKVQAAATAIAKI